MDTTVTTLGPDTHVATIARELPGTVKVFQRHHIDFCCGGKRPLAEACAQAGVPAEELLEELREAAAAPAPERRWVDAPISALVDHIVSRYHDPLRRDLPTIGQLAAKVANRHGEAHPELVAVRDAVAELTEEMLPHLEKEEAVLFPFAVRLATGNTSRLPVGGPILALEQEHEVVGGLLARLRTLTADFTPPGDACVSYKGLYELLSQLDTETQAHIHLENNVLFPRAERLATAL
jgi:regulator of cell morphogenesis and NO signaling